MLRGFESLSKTFILAVFRSLKSDDGTVEKHHKKVSGKITVTERGFEIGNILDSNDDKSTLWAENCTKVFLPISKGSGIML
jgi:hypothetical protein